MATRTELPHGPRDTPVRHWAEVRPAPDAEPTLAAAVLLLRQVAATGGPLELLWLATPRRVGLWLPAGTDTCSGFAEAAWRAAFRGEVTGPGPVLEPGPPPGLVARRVQVTGDRTAPLASPGELTDADPSGLLWELLADAAGEGEHALVWLRATPAGRRASQRALRAAAAGPPGSPGPAGALDALLAAAAAGLSEALSMLLGGSGAPAAPAPASARPVRDVVGERAAHARAGEPAVHARLAVAHTASPAAAARLAAVVGALACPGRQRLRVRPLPPAELWAQVATGAASRRRRPARRGATLLHAGDLAGLVHPPVAGHTPAYLSSAGPRGLDQPDAPAPASGWLRLAADRRGHPLGVGVGDLMRHAYVVGPSGTGKTTLLARLVCELAATRTAAVVLDPHGDLTRQVLAGLDPAGLAVTDVFDLTDPQDLPSLNPMWLAPHADPRVAALARAVRVSSVTALFAELWGLQRASAPNLLHFLDAAVAALAGAGGATLADLPRLLTDAGYRAGVVRAADDARVSARWEEFAALTREDRARTVRAIVNKAAEFERNPLLATVFSDPGPGLRLEPVMDGGRVLLVNLPRGLVPAGTVELLGSLVISALYEAALAREARPPSQRPPVVAVIDEFQEFALSTFGRVLTGARKYGLGLVLANQNLARISALNPELTSTLLANAATLVAFRPGADDARALAPRLAPVTETDLLALPARACYWRTGEAGRTVSAATLAPPEPRRDPDAALRARRLPGRALLLPAGAPPPPPAPPFRRTPDRR